MKHTIYIFTWYKFIAIEVYLEVGRAIRIGLLSIEERCDGIVFVIGHGEPNSDEPERPRGNEVNPLTIKPLTSRSCENNDVVTTRHCIDHALDRTVISFVVNSIKYYHTGIYFLTNLNV